MALRGIQQYIARDGINIARVEDEGNIVSNEGNIFLYPPKKSYPILYNYYIIIFIIIIIYLGLCVSSYYLTIIILLLWNT